jgi:hypothetical protein
MLFSLEPPKKQFHSLRGAVPISGLMSSTEFVGISRHDTYLMGTGVNERTKMNMANHPMTFRLVSKGT